MKVNFYYRLRRVREVLLAGNPVEAVPASFVAVLKEVMHPDGLPSAFGGLELSVANCRLHLTTYQQSDC